MSLLELHFGGLGTKMLQSFKTALGDLFLLEGHIVTSPL